MRLPARLGMNQMPNQPKPAGPELLVLHVEDSPYDAEMIRHQLEVAGLEFRLRRVETRAEMLAALREETPGLILCDFVLPHFGGLAALDLALAACPAVPFIFVSGSFGEEPAVEALKRGAMDYVLKQRLDRLVPSVQRALTEVSERRRRREAEVAQHDSEALYQSLVESLPQNIFRKDLEGRFTFVNGNFCRALGRPAAEILGQTDAAFFPPELAAQYRADDASVVATGRQLERLEQHEQASGKRIHVHVVKHPLRDAAGRVVGIQGSFVDITERKHLEAQARQAQKMEAVGQLAAGVAHDFNNLVTVIRCNAELLLMQAALEPADRELLDQITKAATKAATLNRQLLTFSRKQAIELRSLNLNDITSGMMKLFQRVIAENITLDCRLAPGLPPILADAGMLEQVLMNLVVNSRDAMPAGGRLTISTAPALVNEEDPAHNQDVRPGQFVALSVADTGTGMTPEVQARLFEPFFTTKEPGKGTGLGLATVFGIVKQHEGWIEVASEPGQGTTFRILLPVSATATAPQPETSVDSRPQKGTGTILVVEDEADLRRLTRAILRNAGYTVFEAASGPQALAVWDQAGGQVDVLLADMVMPGGLSGRELAEQLQARRPGLKVIYMSGYTDEFATADFVLRNGSRFMAKPFNSAVLLQTIQEALASRPNPPTP